MKTLIDYQYFNGIFVVNFIDNLGTKTTTSFNGDDIFNGSAINNTADLDALIQSKINSLPDKKATVKYVNLLNETFSIAGQFYPLKTQKIEDLTAPQIAAVNALKVFILSYTGNPLLSLQGELGAHSVTINGVFYGGQSYVDLVAASNGTIVNAILLTIEIFNS
jgi:hypothetical protein